MSPHQDREPYEVMYADWAPLLGVTLPQFKIQSRERHLKNLQNLKSTYGPSALTIVDIEKNEYLFVDDDIEKVTGVPKTRYMEKGPRYILRKASIEHISGLISSTIHQRMFFGKLKDSDKDRYVFNREFSYRGAERKWVLHQIIKHLFNPRKNVFAVAVLQTRIDNLKTFKKFRYFVFDKKQNQIVRPVGHCPNERVESLTERERHIMEMIAEGKSNQNIASALGISYHTVRTHRKNAFKKLNCSNVLEMAAILGTFFRESQD